MMKSDFIAIRILVLCLLALAGCQSTVPQRMAASSDPAGKLVLVEEGKSLAPIVIFKDAPPMTRAAADELAGYIEKISGAKPEIIEGAPDPMPAHAIWVGVQPTVKALFPQIDFDFKHPEEILIAATRDHLVIVGRDRWDPAHLDVQGRNSVIHGKQFEYGTANAVYTFLQDGLGVRWLMPGELGEDVIPEKTIALAPFEFRYHPRIRSRGELFRMSALGDARGHSHDWVRHQRLQLDSLNLPGGHAYTTWWGRFGESHPDYFALQPNGERNGFPEPGKAKLCQSNPAVWDQWLADVETQLAANPYQQVFNGSPNDSWNRGMCICDKCRAWDNPDGAPVMYHWEGLTQEYVSMTDRYITFANHLAAKLKERFPDKDYYVKIGAYGGASQQPPVKAVPADNVIVACVHNFHLREPERRAAEMQLFADWGKVAPHIAWRPNLGNLAGWHVGLPDVKMSQAIEDLRFVGANGCIGIFFDSIWEHWATHGPHFYMLAQMTWNPEADGQAILEDYYQRSFGPAAAEMKMYWDLMVATRDTLLAQGLNVYDLPKVYTDDVLAQADGLLRQAADKAGEQPKYGDRIAFVRVGLEYTRMMRDIRVLMARIEGGDKDPELVTQIDAIWVKIRDLCEGNPLAFNGGWIKPNQRYMKGFHPSHAR